jgi:hypothetical protein
MEVPMSRHRSFALTIATLLITASHLSAQSWVLPAGTPSSATTTSQVISANPFGLLIELFNSEYEIRGGDHVTFGAGASTATVTTYDYSGPTPPASRTIDLNGAPFIAATSYAVERRERYVNSDVFVRYYPGGKAFHGYSLGVKAGLTRIPNHGSFLGVGFDANQSWMLNDHFYLGLGGGLKRLLGADERMFALKFIPTLRRNLGVGF